MSVPIVFIDRDGTVNREIPVVRAMWQFHEIAFGAQGQAANSYLRRLVRRGAKLVWNSRNPDPVIRPKGRLHSMNKRRFSDPAAEHVKLLKEAGIPDDWFLPGTPEVIHCRGKTKGRAMMDFCAALRIPVERTIAFDNEVDQMAGYPAERVIAVDSTIGISKGNFDQAVSLLSGYLNMPRDVTAALSETPLQKPPLP